METYQIYQGYGIRYSSLNGRTEVEYLGMVIKTTPAVGEQRGFELAKKFIDRELMLDADDVLSGWR